MAFGKETITKAKAIISQRKARAEAESNAKIIRLHREIPELKEIDEAFPEIGSRIIALVTEKLTKDEIDIRIANLKAESDALEEARADCLKSNGYPSDYTRPHYSCGKCGDTGYINGKMCECMRRECILLGYENSGLGVLLGKQKFSNFSLEYYTGESKITMEYNLKACIDYAENFGEGAPSMLFIGDTGLGKTHLSTAIAGNIIGRGFNVKYETAQNLISVFSHERFGRNYGDSFGEEVSSDYFNCDLLIIDDFGTEESNQFSISVFYNLINTRINRGLPVIINTNLREKEIRARYADRITSRLFGEFTVLAFPGRDIRMQNLLK